MDNRLPSDEELHAFIDGELEADRAHAFADMVAASPKLTELVERYRADKDLIAHVFGPLIDLPLPAAMADAAAERGSVVTFKPRRTLYRAAMALAATFVIGFIGYPIIMRITNDPLVAEAIVVRSGAIRPDNEISSAAIADVAARDRFADDTLAVPIKVPALEKDGYVLAAVAAYPESGQRHALQLTYRGRDGTTFTMFLRPSKGPDRFELSRRADLQVCVWQDDDLSVVMLGTMPARDMLKVATATYADLNF